MSRRTRTVTVLVIATFMFSLLSFLDIAVSSHVVRAEPGPNLLVNPDFEGGMRRTSLSSWTADGWYPWFRPHAASDPPGVNWEPEFGIIRDRPGQAHSGAQSQRWFNTWAIHDAGIAQQVKVPRGSKVTFNVWVFSWSSQNDQWAVSEARYDKWVGIDPNGGTDPFSGNVQWTNPDATMDRWLQLSISAMARGDSVTVFVRGRPHFSVKNNNILVDDAFLTATPPEPAPAPAFATPESAPSQAPALSDVASEPAEEMAAEPDETTTLEPATVESSETPAIETDEQEAPATEDPEEVPGEDEGQQ
ncbi:MAG: hypothetical protein HY675_29240 [Chloroflexi bacterium]|nr:hypothetical protein [Chloroflexota bacterium]